MQIDGYTFDSKKEGNHYMELKYRMLAGEIKDLELQKQYELQESFVNAIRRFLEVQVLTSPLLQELIDHIDVFETEGVGKSRTQRVAVYYRFVGYIEIPELPRHRNNVKADTR